MDVGLSFGALGVGAGSTLLVRRQFDNQGETTVFRPSVLWGLGTGVAGVGVPMLMDMRGMSSDFLMDYGEAAITAGLISAFSPKGGGVQIPTL